MNDDYNNYEDEDNIDHEALWCATAHRMAREQGIDVYFYSKLGYGGTLENEAHIPLNEWQRMAAEMDDLEDIMAEAYPKGVPLRYEIVMATARKYIDDHMEIKRVIGSDGDEREITRDIR